MWTGACRAPAAPLEAPDPAAPAGSGRRGLRGARSPASSSALQVNLLSHSSGRKRWPSDVDDWMGL